MRIEKAAHRTSFVAVAPLSFSVDISLRRNVDFEFIHGVGSTFGRMT